MHLFIDFVFQREVQCLAQRHRGQEELGTELSTLRLVNQPLNLLSQMYFRHSGTVL